MLTLDSKWQIDGHTMEECGIAHNGQKIAVSADNIDSGLCRPKERAINCPNCGELHWESELRYSSQKSIVVSSGSFHSTLYGVCQKCAERHSR